MNSGTPPVDALRCSIIIPARNAAAYLGRTLPAVLDAAARVDAEILLVDDGSHDGTAAVAAGFGAAVTTLREASGAAAARNAGVQKATGDLLVFVDADVEVHPETFLQMRDIFAADKTVAALFGSYDDDPADPHPVSCFRNLLHHYTHQHTHQQNAGNATTFWTGLGAVRREVFEAVGEFHSANLFCMEDIDYGHRLVDAGYRILLRPDIQGKHLKRWTLGSMITTDFLRRGIPWTYMMLNRQRLERTLNVTVRERVSAILATSAVAGLVIGGAALLAGGRWSAVAGLGAAGILMAILTAIQWNFYRLLYRKGGMKMAFLGGILHVTYYVVATAAAATAGLLWLVRTGDSE